MSGPYEDFLEPVERALSALPARSRAIVFAFGGERLLPSYARLAPTTSSDPEVLRRALDWVWSAKPDTARVPSFVDAIAEVTPHGDDYPTLLGLAAQDACIAIDCAVREAGEGGVSAKAVWYCFEPLLAVVCEELTGAMDAGSGEEAERTERRVVSDARLLAERQLFMQVISMLQSGAEAVPRVKALATPGVGQSDTDQRPGG